MTKLPLFALIFVAAGAMAADSNSDARDLAKALAGRTPGKPVDCVSSSWVEGPQIIGDRILLYREGGRVMRNDLPAACPGLDDDSIIVAEIHGSQLCRSDLFYTLQRGGSRIPGPHCQLGKFTPYEKPKR